MGRSVNPRGDEARLVTEIAKRSKAAFDKAGNARTLMDCRMDILVANRCCPLKLEELANASDADFAHDVEGIARHLNHETWELDNFFLPRFAK